MHWGLVKAIIVLPGTVLVFVPVIVLSIAKNSKFSHQFAGPDQILFWVALTSCDRWIELKYLDRCTFHEVWQRNPCPMGPSTKIGYPWSLPLCQKSDDHSRIVYTHS